MTTSTTGMISARSWREASLVSIEVAVGDTVKPDQTLVVLEAMKMEHKLSAGGAGVVKEILVGVGDTVDYQAPLIVVEES